ncbi:class I SAM-dependent methyltransferase [Mesorhizobium sp. J428]|uniref:class I SAM-dependent methyltransferase n=1 Tax=Mesorhizobium sp. J428 TaxID=2898440 RepID=UPI002150E17E|nr:class I SAM-dependent methyltransferase [Mesorhizobium sp. J428]MCR5857395.1 class I SAM-dependent methyltransferase [Mesorhizobium sp. J428]
MKAERASSSDLESLPPAYAAWRARRLGQVTDALEQDLILKLIGPPAGLRILDVGCGDGVLVVELAGPAAHVTGVDPSPEMIAAARRRAERQRREVSLELGKAEKLPFEADTFDVVVAVTVLCFVEDTAGALREMIRVLKPGGRLIVGELGKWSTWAAIRRIKAWLGSPVWRRARFRSAVELRSLASGAGLVDVSVKGAVFYPPSGLAARMLGPIDHKIGACTTLGAAFLALAATKTCDVVAKVSRLGITRAELMRRTDDFL